MKYWKTMVYLVLLLAFAGCANRPAYTPIRAEKFGQSPFPVSRLHIILNMPQDYRSRLVQPLEAELVIAFRERGINAGTEFQAVNPLALDSRIRFDKARLNLPDAIMVIRLPEGTSYSSTLHIDLMDGKGKGIWRGMSTLNRMTSIESTAKQFSQELVKKLVDEAVVGAIGQRTI